MAGDIYEGCFECGADCIQTQFCLEETANVGLPKHLNIKVIANPDFWGFGSSETNVLISGWAFFNDGYFDFFDGYDENHFATKTCGMVTQGPYANEQRPDVLYRSVYTPTGVKHYGADGYEDGIERGGAEIYLVDQQAGQSPDGGRPTADGESCDESDPTQVFKKNPENFGLGNKILFADGIYKNATGAWRLVDVETPNSGNLVESEYVASVCSSGQDDGVHPTGVKQSVIRHRNFLQNYDPFRFRAEGDFPTCLPDGSVVDKYKGLIHSIVRDTGVNNLVRAEIRYNGGTADAIYRSSTLLLNTGGIAGSYDNAFKVVDVSTSGGSTIAYLAGTFGQENFTTPVNESGTWVMANSHDPQTCCSKFAYGVDDEYKRGNLDPNFHNDFGRVFNNAKNLRQSNREPENRHIYPFNSITPLNADGEPRVDYSYPSVNDDGTFSSNYEKKLPYYGPFYEVDLYDDATRVDQKRGFEIGKNFTCATKRNTLDMFPSCMTQTYQYTRCGGGDAWSTNRIPRLSFVYRGANFYDTCKFDDDGLPFTDWNNSPPTNIDQLRSGLAGLEINMFINLGDARGAMIQPETPCDCDDPGGGNNPPQWESITSPITFPSFPKYDLYPEDYGCQDPQFQQNEAYEECDDSNTPCCGFGVHPWVCNVKQPYTTYGYMRSLCGQETDDRMSVITNGFSQLTQQGNARNTTPGSGNNEPVYWEFSNPDVMFSGSAAGDPPFIGTGNYPFWGIADDAGRLAAPYFRNVATSGSYNDCGSIVDFDYLSFDRCTTAKQGWPTDNVPFLIEIDHDDSCLGCVTPQMESEPFTASIQGLLTEYSYDADGKHGFNYCLYKGTRQTPANYSCESGWPGPCPNGALADFPAYEAALNDAYVGNTCPLATGQTVSLEPIHAYSTGDPSLLLGWSTWGTANSFVPIDKLQWSDNFLESVDNLELGTRDGLPYTTYVSMRLACPEMMPYLFKPFPNFPMTGVAESGYISPLNYYDGTDPVNALLGAGGIGCQHHYPSADSDLQLDVSFCLVTDLYADIFNLIPEHAIRTDSSYQEKLEDYIRYDILDIITQYEAFGCDYYEIKYGCYGPDSYGASGFYPCNGAQCASGVITPRDLCECGACCICGNVQNYDDLPESSRGVCSCDCNMQIATITKWNSCSSSGLVVEDNAGSGCNFIPKAVAYSGDFGFLGPIYYGVEDYDIVGHGPYSATSESACRWKSGLNEYEEGVLHYINKPEKKTAPEGCGLTPDNCEPTTCAQNSNVGRGLCGYPIPFPSGSQAETSGISVLRRSCYPEIMLVSKVDCLDNGYDGDGYRLHVSREYHTHDRTWQELKSDPEGGLACYTKAYGGYQNGSCTSIPYANPADGVTPTWNSGLPCLVSKPTGVNAGQDFLFNDGLWNYYNLFYESGFYTGEGTYYRSLEIGDDSTGYAPVCPSTEDGSGLYDIFGSGLFFNAPGTTLTGTSGTLAVNGRNSCLQSLQDCGPELYCNKMFFPRRSHEAGTVITKFGAMQICTANATKTFAPWHDGYQDLAGIDLELETKHVAPFIDTCDTDIHQYLTYPIGINDTELIVPDVLPLMGIDKDKFRYLNDVKSCVLATTGCIPVWTHTDQSISAGIHAPKTWANNKETSFTYYLDKTVASGVDGCLFTPFKIMVDVDCCTSNIRRKSSNDPPSNLDYVLTDVPSEFCGGMVKDHPCDDCDATTCGGSLIRDDQPDTFACVPLYNTAYKVFGEADVPVDSGGLCSEQTNVTGAYTVDLYEGAVIVGGTPIDFDYNYIYPISGGFPVECGETLDGTPLAATIASGDVLIDVSGTKYITYGLSSGWAWTCGGTTYLGQHILELDPLENCCFPLVPSEGCGFNPDPNTGSGCCQDITICNLLTTSYAWDGSSTVLVEDASLINHTTSGNKPHLDPNCGCAAAQRFAPCDDSNLLINLTQG